MQQPDLFPDTLHATDCSIDIETLDTTPSSVILSIGAVFFIDDTLCGETYIEIDVQDQLDLKRTVSSATLHWWSEQNPNARKVFATTYKMSLASALQELTAAYRLHPKVERVWAKGPSFDLVILEHAYRHVGQSPPWRYSQHRDIRTLLDLAKACEIPILKPAEVSHNALDDAKTQAEFVSQFYGGVSNARSFQASG